jgi:hypothetical protein
MNFNELVYTRIVDGKQKCKADTIPAIVRLTLFTPCKCTNYFEQQIYVYVVY